VVAHPEPTVLLTVRTPDLTSHAGQISFPGGKIDPHDETPLAAAIREGEEEIGLDPRFVDPIGYLDLYLTFSGFRILPALVRVNPGFSLSINPSEVAEAFEVPLPFLMEPANHAQKTREWRNIQRTYLEMPYGDRHIWGITAGILHNLYQRIYAG
jgi:8-oxo-dGTP pyrophosphatase MutT (NUDIX family)